MRHHGVADGSSFAGMIRGYFDMTAKDWFGLFVRTIGLIAILFSSWMAFGIIVPTEGYRREEFTFSCIISLAMGLILLRWADKFVAFTYRNSN